MKTTLRLIPIGLIAITSGLAEDSKCPAPEIANEASVRIQETEDSVDETYFRYTLKNFRTRDILPLVDAFEKIGSKEVDKAPELDVEAPESRLFGSLLVVMGHASNTIVITGPAADVKRIKKAIKQVDAPRPMDKNVKSDDSGCRSAIAIKHADVCHLSDILNSLLEVRRQMQRMIEADPTRPGAPAPMPAGVPRHGTDDFLTQVIPDARTNRIVVLGRPEDVSFVEGIIRELGSEASDLQTP